MPDNVNEINKQFAKGSAWMILFKVFDKSISIVSTIILARLLAPEDFGLITMAMMVVALLELMRAFGFDMALIQNQDATDEHYNTAWTFNIIAAIFISLSLLALTPFAGSFYNDERLLEIVPVLAIGVFISGFENIGIVAFRKDLTFHKDFTYLLSRKVIGFVIGISLALYYKNYWALVGAFVATKFAVIIFSFYIHPYRPNFCLTKAKELFSFSSWLFINNILTFINQKASAIVIGKMTGASDLGLFTISREISTTTSGGIVIPLNRAAFPAYSKLKDNLPELKRSFLNTLGMIGIITIPASVGLAAVTPIMVPVLLGEKWLDIIPIMQILVFSGLIFAAANIAPLYMALGVPRITTKILLLRSIIFIPLLIYSTNQYGIIGAAWSLLFTAIIMWPISYWPVTRILDIRLTEIIKKFLRPIIASGTMYIVITYLYLTYMSTETLNFGVFKLMILITVGILTYLIILLMAWQLVGRPDGSEQQVIDTLKKKLKSS